jgi:hypothetical protein
MQFLLRCFLCAAALTVSLPAQTSATDDATFRKLQLDWAEARKHQDVAFLERFYATEFTVGNIAGAEESREQDIGVFRSKILKPAVITDTEMVVHRYGDTRW